MDDGEGAPPPLGGRGTPDEQARAIVARIILDTPGAAHIVAKPRLYHHNSLNPEGPGDGDDEKERRQAEGEAEKG